VNGDAIFACVLRYIRLILLSSREIVTS